MNHWAFVWSAYGLTAITTLALLIYSILAMRTAERRVDQTGEKQ